jgi:N-acetylglucosaminyldiphosphoundecaprenol N-acetyl-beta-D-mannosaminyltransferase
MQRNREGGMNSEQDMSVGSLNDGRDSGATFLRGGVRCTTDVPSFEILGVRIHAVESAETIELLHAWIEDRLNRSRYVANAAMHTLAAARRDKSFRHVLNSADLVVPDGTPLVWTGRIKGCEMRRRVSGCDLLDSFCRVSRGTYRHFFYGGTPLSAQNLARTLQEKFGIVVAGTYAPPFRPLTQEEDAELATMVEDSSPDVLWVGLSSPKQETFMYEHRHKLKVPLMVGVGAAFDLNCGNVPRAPMWMRDHGLEWLFRLAAEPRRLWKRYLITIPHTLWFVSLELLGFLKVPVAESHGGQNEHPIS